MTGNVLKDARSLLPPTRSLRSPTNYKASLETAQGRVGYGVGEWSAAGKVHSGRRESAFESYSDI